jgi:methionyl-tRNA synthetase
MPRFSITTTLPYVNAKPHIGFAREIAQADAVARFHKLLGEEAVFNTGVDEHGAKIYEKALELGKTPQAYCDEMAEHFRDPWEKLHIGYTHFIRTTDEKHIAAAQEFWRRCEANGDMYKKHYSIKYCVGCELEKTDSDLDHGTCPDHPKSEIRLIDEENYFFRFSKYRDDLLQLYKERPDFVVPKKRLNEITAFVGRGLQDFSVSRLKAKMPWGVPVPGDDDHVMYVWFDALVNYISTLGWGSDDEREFVSFWPSVQLCGKDNVRQQSAMWQAMLLSAGIEPSKRILVNGFITVDGMKMSKSIGNVIAPDELVTKFGADGTRYLLLSLAPIGEDCDVTWQRLTEKYHADLSNGLGNLVSRVLKLSEQLAIPTHASGEEKSFPPDFERLLEECELSEGLAYIWQIVRDANRFIEERKPWELAKSDAESFERTMRKLLADVALIAKLVQPFLPDTSAKIQTMLEGGERVILFPRV